MEASTACNFCTDHLHWPFTPRTNMRCVTITLVGFVHDSHSSCQHQDPIFLSTFELLFFTSLRFHHVTFTAIMLLSEKKVSGHLRFLNRITFATDASQHAHRCRMAVSARTWHKNSFTFFFFQSDCSYFGHDHIKRKNVSGLVLVKVKEFIISGNNELT